MKRFLDQNRGSILIAMTTLLLVISAAISTMTTSRGFIKKKVKYSERKSEMDSISQEIVQVLAESDICIKTFEDPSMIKAPATPVPFNDIINPSGSPIYTTGQVFPTTQISLTKMEFGGEFTGLNAEKTQGDTELRLTFKKLGKYIGGEQIIRTVKVAVTLDAAHPNGNIIHCRTTPKDGTNAWKKSDIDPQNIYLDIPGHVLVGNNDPLGKDEIFSGNTTLPGAPGGPWGQLEVKGDMRITKALTGFGNISHINTPSGGPSVQFFRSGYDPDTGELKPMQNGAWLGDFQFFGRSTNDSWGKWRSRIHVSSPGGSDPGSDVRIDLMVKRDGQYSYSSGGKNRLTMFSSNGGRIGLQDTSPDATLDVHREENPDLAGVRAWDIDNTSDRRFKKNIVTLKNSLDLALKLRPVTYFWKNKDKDIVPRKQYGLIAQDVQKVLPEIVNADSEGKLSLNYLELTPIILESSKSLLKVNHQLNKTNDTIEHRAQDALNQSDEVLATLRNLKKSLKDK